MKKTISIIALSFILVTFAGCSDFTPTTTTYTEQQKSEQNQKSILNSIPTPTVTTSLERRNVAKRIKTFDNENKVSYIYLINYGRIMAFYTVSGKVSSLRSYLAPTDKMVKADGGNCGDRWTSDASMCQVMEAPDADGTYGENVEGIFFYTTDGAYVEWNGTFMMSDFPLALTDKPALTREVK